MMQHLHIFGNIFNVFLGMPPCQGMFDGQFRNGTGVRQVACMILILSFFKTLTNLPFCTICRCWVAGWGRDGVNGAFQPVQHKVDVPIFERRSCSQTLRQALLDRRSRNAGRFKLHNSEICAGGETGKDACDGDGGAPLVCQAQEGNWYILHTVYLAGRGLFWSLTVHIFSTGTLSA